MSYPTSCKESPTLMADDLDPLRKYATCMEELKLRTNVILSITSGSFTIAGREDFSTELACLHLRKALELLAFASLTANRGKYAEAHRNFTQHWNAKRLLENLERIHPDFYPRPVTLDNQERNGIKNFTDVTAGYLTREDFVFLYDTTSQVLHTRNPFSREPGTIDFGYSIAEWVGRIQALLSTHYMRLVDSASLWVVFMKHPEDGRVHVLKADPQPFGHVG